MMTLMEALAAERSKRQRNEADASTRQQIGRAVLEALADRLNAEPPPGWTFVLAGQEIGVFRTISGARQQVGTWTVDEGMRLVTGGHKTEWITSESWSRVVDEAIQITAQLILDAEGANAEKLNNDAEPGEGAEIVELAPRF